MDKEYAGLGLLLFPDELEIVRTGRICTIEEMEEWVGTPCDEWTPGGCATCDSWQEWKQCLTLLIKQDKFRKDMDPTTNNLGARE
jgi:hypothetical protein